MTDPRELPIFTGLNKLEVDEVFTYTRGESKRKGEMVFEEGQPAEAFYVLTEGEVEILKRNSGGEYQRITMLAPPSVFGETVIFLDRKMRIAAVKTLSDVAYVRIDLDAFLDRVEKGSLGTYKIIRNLAKVVARRLQAVDEELVRRLEHASGAERKQLQEFAKFKDKLFHEWTF